MNRMIGEAQDLVTAAQDARNRLGWAHLAGDHADVLPAAGELAEVTLELARLVRQLAVTAEQRAALADVGGPE